MPSTSFAVFFRRGWQKDGWACFDESNQKKTWGSNPVFWVMLPMPSGQSGPLRCDERRRGLLRLLGVCCFKVHPCRIIADLALLVGMLKEFGGWGDLWVDPHFCWDFFGTKKQGLGCTCFFSFRMAVEISYAWKMRKTYICTYIYIWLAFKIPGLKDYIKWAQLELKSWFYIFAMKRAP